MTKPFEVEDNKTRISGVTIVAAERLTGFGAGLPEEFGVESQEKAELLERRLSRLEKEIGLPRLD